ncbi:hypothetical protein L218DRAFT_1002829 [Marasmius fiardii PR-910]|nr:hypothetical protein L218DRAFT_1002829 [Marasmius fiardii PR-910]
MFGISLPSWRSKPRDLEAANPPPSKKKGLHLDTSLISGPIPLGTPISITGFDIEDNRGNRPPHSSPVSSSPTRTGPSNIAWLRKGDSEDVEDNEDKGGVKRLPILYPPLPAVVRLDGKNNTYPVTRSVSSPTPYTNSFDPSTWSSSSRKWNLNSAHAGSTHSLRLDTQHHRPMLSNGSAHSYPLTKPLLSPIIEQDYTSPSAPFKPIPLPSVSDTTDSTPLSTPAPAPSLAGSTSSERSERQSPAHSHPFISRPVNRSISQTSHKSNTSTSSSAAAPSSLFPLDFRSDSSGPTPIPSVEGFVPPLRSKKSCSFPPPPLPTITAGSSEDEEDDRVSFVTADDSISYRPPSSITVKAEHELLTVADYSTTAPQPPMDRVSVPAPVVFAASGMSVSMIHSNSVSPSSGPRSPPSASSSFIDRRWDREGGAYPPVMPVFKVPKRHWWNDATPAFWTFWLGFVVCPLAPILWLVGGWGFTYFGEIPPPESRAEKVMSVWEFYIWKGLLFCLCCSGRRDKRHIVREIERTKGGNGHSSLSKWSWGRARKQKGKEKESVSGGIIGNSADIESLPRPPRWVSEKQSSDFRRAKLNDPIRSLKGIYFGYPFVPRDGSAAAQGDSQHDFWDNMTKPFDHIYGVKLTEVHGKPEGGRRMFDPWIQRCRYAFCYGMLIVCAGLACGTAVLLVYNTRA